MYRVRYLNPTETVKLFHNEDAAKAFVADLHEKHDNQREAIREGKRHELIVLLDELPELKEMDEHPISMDAVNIIIRNPSHFAAVLRFAEVNGLSDQFNKSFAQLMQLLANSKGEAELWPDGYRDPSFGWKGCGMVGGFIFHRSTREWSIHT